MFEVQPRRFLANHLDRGQRGGQVAVEQIIVTSVFHDAFVHVLEVTLGCASRGGELRERPRRVLRLRRGAFHAQNLEALAHLDFVHSRSVQARRSGCDDAARRGDHRSVAVRDETREFLRRAHESLRRAVRQLHQVLERGGEGPSALFFGRADHNLQHFAHVFVSKRLLRDLHQ